MGIEGYIPHFDRHGRNQGFSIDKFSYDKEKDKYICPEGNFLNLSNVNKSNKSKVYAGERKVCRQCPLKEQCLSKSAKRKTIERPLHQDYADKTYAREGSAEYTRIQKLRRVWCEGTNGILKENHNLTRTRKRGIANILEHCLLSALVINLKRYLKALKNKAQQQKVAGLITESLVKLRKWLGNNSLAIFVNKPICGL